jgi:hypothetical protein
MQAMSDTHINSVKRDGTHPRDGSLQRDNLLDVFIFIARYTPTATEAVDMQERFSVGMRYHRLRDGAYPRDGTVLRNNMVLILLE